MTDPGQDAAGDVFRTTVHASGRSRVNYVGKENINRRTGAGRPGEYAATREGRRSCL
ncbi:MAG: hypothetical protein ACRDTG_23105 [Pseudonocardiaceae bacterium]